MRLMAATAAMAHLYLRFVSRFPKSRVRFNDLSPLGFHNNNNKNIVIIKLALFSELGVCSQVACRISTERENLI